MIRKYIYSSVLAVVLMTVSPCVMAQVIGEDTSIDMSKPSDDDSPSSRLNTSLPGETIQALLYKSDGAKIGFAVMRKAPRGVMVTLSLSKLASGWHGVHVHTNPDCTFTQISPFAASGDHFGAEGLSHGFMTGGGPQNGDLPNVWIASNGTGRAEFYSNLIDFEDVVKDKGRSILIDASADDHINQPSGSSGIHVACGVLRREAPDKN